MEKRICKRQYDDENYDLLCAMTDEYCEFTENTDAEVLCDDFLSVEVDPDDEENLEGDY